MISFYFKRVFSIEKIAYVNQSIGEPKFITFSTRDKDGNLHSTKDKPSFLIYSFWAKIVSYRSWYKHGKMV